MMTGCRLSALSAVSFSMPVCSADQLPAADGSFGMLLSLTPGVNKHNVAWHG